LYPNRFVKWTETRLHLVSKMPDDIFIWTLLRNSKRGSIGPILTTASLYVYLVLSRTMLRHMLCLLSIASQLYRGRPLLIFFSCFACCFIVGGN